MKNIKIVINKKSTSFDLPECWDEIPNHLYPSIARLSLRKTKHMNEQDKLVRALAILMDKKIDVLWKLSEWDIMALLEHVAWVLGDIVLSTNKIPSITHQAVKYLGPASDFSNLRFGEFVMAETYFMHYIESENENKEALCKLAAVLYRKKGIGDIYTPGHSDYRGDERHKFNTNLVDDQAKEFMQVDIDILEGVFLWYAITRDKVFSYFPNVFNKRKSSGASGGKGAAAYGWMGVFDDLLGEKGRTAESLEEEFVTTTLLSLERAQIRVKELKRKK